MKILLTGANGYIGARLLVYLGEAGHEIYALVRSKRRISVPEHLKSQVTVIVGNLLQAVELPADIDVAYYLVHSMGKHSSEFERLEEQAAENFRQAIEKTECKQIIYLSGLSRGEGLSEHMRSRQHVEEVLKKGKISVTVFRAGIIIGSGSASFEIIRDLVEKLPVMVAPKWVRSRCNPIGVSDVMHYLTQAIGNKATYGRCFEIGGAETLTYLEMLLRFAKLRGLKRSVITVPVLTPRVSSYWLLLVTSTSFPLAQALVDSLKHNAVCKERSIDDVIPHTCLTYEQALKRAFNKIEQNAVVSSWKNAIIRSDLEPNLKHYIQVPEFGCVKEVVACSFDDREAMLDRLWSIGGERGWYYMNWAWNMRGALDKLVGGVGLRRGRTNLNMLNNGDALDFWRVLLADREKGRLLLFAEMRLPGEAWLEFTCHDHQLTQTATFRPWGVLGRLYWYVLYPFHYFIFRGLCRSLAQGKS
ncbi:MAG: SDR family oxidoreductase [Chlamydiia bacterium]|nr:SDR family oxidoreductase [Chlamydiia bacterium]